MHEISPTSRLEGPLPAQAAGTHGQLAVAQDGLCCEHCMVRRSHTAWALAAGRPQVPPPRQPSTS